MSNARSILERGAGGASPPPDGYGRMLRRHARKHRNQRIAAGALGIAIMAVLVVAVASVIGRDRDRLGHGPTPTPSLTVTPTPTPTPTPSPTPSVIGGVGVIWEDSFVDVDTGRVTPLPSSITSIPGASDYDVSPDGTKLLFGGGSQVFIANINGTEVRRVSSDPVGAAPAGWSPDGTLIAYTAGPGLANEALQVDLVVMDVGSGATTIVTTAPVPELMAPHFGPDGNTILFYRYTGQLELLPADPTDAEKLSAQPDLWSVSVSTGETTLLLEHRAGASYSPDGETLAFPVSYETPGGLSPRAQNEHHSELWLADADGANPRFLTHGGGENPRWSPDGTRIMVGDSVDAATDAVGFIDVSTGERRRLYVAFGSDWVDDDTIVVMAWQPATPNS